MPARTAKDRVETLRRKLIKNELNPIMDVLLSVVILVLSPLIALSAFAHDRLMFKFLNRTYIYNVSWEDPRMDHRVFNLSDKDHVVTIASAGCNALDYIIEGALVTAVDFNSCQIALTELKKVAILHVDWETFFDIFSMSNMKLLQNIYPTKLRPHLSKASAEFWDDGIFSIKSFMYSGTSGQMSWVLFRVLFPLFGLGFIRDEILAGTPKDELVAKIGKSSSNGLRGIAWLLDNIMLRGGCCFAGVPERQMALGLHRPNNLGLVIERVFFKTDLVHDNYFYAGYFLGHYTKENCPRYLMKENYAAMRANLKKGKLILVNGTMLDAIDNSTTPITVASLLDHMDWMTDAQINEEMNHLIRKMDPVNGKIFWRTFADDVHAAPLQWLNPSRVGHADDEDSDDRVGMYWTTWIANIADCKVSYDERVVVNQSKGLMADLSTGLKIVTFPFWKPFVSSSLSQQGHAKDMESFYKYQKDGYDAFRENLLHARPALMDAFPLAKKGGMVWVDVGGGTARNLEYMTADTIRKHFKSITIVDISASLLEVAAKRVKLMGLEDIVNVVEHDCTKQSVLKVLPKAGTVDAVTMSYSFSMIPDQKGCMDNIIKLLKPSTGFVAIADFFLNGVYDDFLPPLARRLRQIESMIHKQWFAMDHVHLLSDKQVEYKGLESIWDNRFRGGVPFIPLMQPYHGVKILRKVGK